VTGDGLTLSLRHRSLWLSVLVPCTSILLEVCYQLLDTSFHIAQLLTDVYLLVLRILTAVVWYLFCMALGTTADKALKSLQLVSRSCLHENYSVSKKMARLM
jgi:hypothetical protein